jgi:Holliday junction resolvase-like predicted endonuclease
MDMAAVIDESTREAADAALLDQAHQQALRVSIREAAGELQALLTRQMAAYVANVKDVKTITRWVRGAVTDIRPESEARLRTAYEIFALLTRFEAPDTVRAWFIGMCPQLGDVSPARAIHDGDLQGALNAARTFAAYA